MSKNIPNTGRIGLADVLDLNKRQTALSINAVKIGIVRAFNKDTQRADVEIAYKQVKEILADGTRVYQEYPLLMDLPVVVLFGGVDFLSLPIQEGDNCLVLFNDNEIDQWAKNGNGGNCSTFRMHDLSDGIALVGIRPLTNSIVGYLANGIRLSHGGGNSQIDLKDNLIESIATLFLHHGNMQIKGNLLVEQDFTVLGDAYGNGNGDFNLRANLRQQSGRSIHAGNGATGTFNVVTVVDGIVVGGS